MKQVIVACGSGVATSQIVAKKIRNLLEKENIQTEVIAIGIDEVDNYINDCVAYVAITKVRKEYTVPIINGITFLTGVGQAAEFKKLVEACN